MSEQPLPAPRPDDQPIEAGEVGKLKDLPFHEAKHLAETIIEPGERQQLAQHLRAFVDGCDTYGQQILLAETPVNDSLFPSISVAFPALRVRNKAGGEHILPAPSSVNEVTLRDRGRVRQELLHGLI